MPVSPAEDIHVDLSEMNHTELVMLARWIGLTGITRAIPRTVLIRAISNFEQIEFKNPVDQYRKMMSGWLRLHWKRLQMQAYSKVCPNCDRCSDMRALDCYLINRSQIKS